MAAGSTHALHIEEHVPKWWAIAASAPVIDADDEEMTQHAHEGGAPVPFPGRVYHYHSQPRL